MLVNSDGKVDDAEASLNAGMEDVTVTKVPISIITGQWLFFFTLSVALLWYAVATKHYPAPAGTSSMMLFRGQQEIDASLTQLSPSLFTKEHS